MSLVSAGFGITWPGPLGYASTPSVASGSTLDAAGEYIAVIAQAEEDMVVSHVGFRTGTCAGAPTADIRIETVSAGLPSGTLFGTNTNIVTATLVSTTFALHALTAAATIPKGAFYAVKVGYNSGTSFITALWATSTWTNYFNRPYQVINIGTPTISRISSPYILVLGSSTTTFYAIPGIVPINVYTAGAFSNSVAGAKRGLRFQVPFKTRLRGLEPWMSTAVGDFNIICENDAGTELSSSSTAISGADTAGISAGSLRCIFDNTIELSPATWYRAMLEPTSATNINLSTVTLPSAAYLSGMPGVANMHYTVFTTAGGYDDTQTALLPLMNLILDQFGTDAATGGGARVIGG